MKTKTTKKTSPRKLSDLQPNKENPRKITGRQLEALKASLLEFGDLSGIVYNVSTGKLVGGHQRVDLFTQAKYPAITYFEQVKKPTAQGTVATGSIVIEGNRYHYREVKWTKDKEKAAMIAANSHGGNWDDELLKKLLSEMDEPMRALAGWDAEARIRLETWQSNLDLVKKTQPTNSGIISTITVECPQKIKDTVIDRIKKSVADLSDVTIS